MSLSPKKAQEAEKVIRTSIARISDSYKMLSGTVRRLMVQAEATVDFVSDLRILDEAALKKPVDASGNDYATCVGRFLTSLGINGDIDDILDIREHTTKTMLREINSRQRYLDGTAAAKIPTLVTSVQVEPVTNQVNLKSAGEAPSTLFAGRSSGKSFVEFFLTSDYWIYRMRHGVTITEIKKDDEKLYRAFYSRVGQKKEDGEWSKGSLSGAEVTISLFSSLANSSETSLVNDFHLKYRPGVESVMDFANKVYGYELDHEGIVVQDLHGGDETPEAQKDKPFYLALFNAWENSLPMRSSARLGRSKAERAHDTKEFRLDLFKQALPVTRQVLGGWISNYTPIGPRATPANKPVAMSGTS